jgi:hypothetical protein
MAYLDDPVIAAMLREGRSPVSFMSGLGRSRMDEIDAGRSMQGQDAFVNQERVASVASKPKGYLDQIYEDVNPSYFVDDSGMPLTDNIQSFAQAGRTYSDDADSKMQRLQYEWDARNKRDSSQNDFRANEGALNRGLRSLTAWLAGANQGTGALNAPENAEQFKQEVAPYVAAPAVGKKSIPLVKASDETTSSTQPVDADYADYAKRFRLKHPKADDATIKSYYQKKKQATGVK